MTRDKLRVGLLIGGGDIGASAKGLATWLAAHPGIAPVLMPAAAPRATPPAGGLRRLVDRLETPRARKTHPDYGRRLPRDALALPGAGDGPCDVILTDGETAIPPGMAARARHGIWRIRRGEDGAGGFSDVLSDAPSTRLAIERRRDAEGPVEILAEGDLATQKLWRVNDALLEAKAQGILRRLLDDLAGGQTPAVRRTRPDRAVKEPGRGDLLRYLARVWGPVLGGRAAALPLGPATVRWSVAWQRTRAVPPPLDGFREIPNPPGRMLADPFVITHRGRTAILAEDLFYSDDRGRISAIEMTGDGPGPARVVLDEPFHLSFPFVFEAEGRVWMIPETAEARQIRLYSCEDFPFEWKLHAILMDDVQAADTMLIAKDDRWFMLTNICSAGIGDQNSELHVFHGPRFDGTDWTPVSQGNPVVFDSLRSRNGGLLRRDGTWVRVNQIQARDHYGAGFGLNVITKLDAEGYAEERIETIDPGFATGAVSSHHLHMSDGHAVVDYARPARLKRLLAED